MGKPRAKWWGYVRRVVYDYPRMRAELDALKAPMQSAGEQVCRGSGVGRPAEVLASVTLPDRQEQRELEAVEKAMDESDKLTNTLVSLYFFQKYSMEGAATRAYLSKDRAYKLIALFLHSVALNMRLEEIF